MSRTPNKETMMIGRTTPNVASGNSGGGGSSSGMSAPTTPSGATNHNNNTSNHHHHHNNHHSNNSHSMLDKHDRPLNSGGRRPYTIMSSEDVAAGKKTHWSEMELTGNVKYSMNLILINLVE